MSMTSASSPRAPPRACSLHGTDDQVAAPNEVERVVAKLRTQKGIVIDYDLVEGANHYWSQHIQDVEDHVGAYVSKRMAADAL